MTEQQLYAILDKTAQSIGPILSFKADPVAIRDFKDIASDQKSIIHKHIDEFELVALGSIVYDDQGRPHIEAATRTVLTGSSLKALFEAK